MTGRRPSPGARLLVDDVAEMIREQKGTRPEALAHDIITVVRERVLRDIQTYARENTR